MTAGTVAAKGQVGSGTPIWGIRPTRQPGVPTAVLPESCDVLVVGGGITGLALVHWLRGRAGAVLVERDRIGAGASGRNAGFLLAGVSSCYAVAVRRYGRARAAALWQFTADTHDLLAAALDGRASAYRRLGGVTQAGGPEERLDLAESADLLGDDGFPVEHREGRLVNPRDGELDPVEALEIFAADAAPGIIREGVEVVGLETGQGGVRVHSLGGACRAGVVVLATNAYTPLLVPGVGIRPIRAQVAATAPSSHRLVDRPTYADRGFQYWRQLIGGRVLAGGYRDRDLEHEVGYDTRPSRLVQEYLTAHLRALGAGTQITHRWAGIMGFTPDALPLVGCLPDLPNVYFAVGFTGGGMGYGPL
nr:FAD-binding oxidoreductase [Candidatus Dormibacteraeota bacterium]